MSREVRNGEHLIAKRWNEQQIHLREDARHLLRDLPAKAIGLHEVDRGEESRLAKSVRPGVGDLHFELIDLVAQRQLFKRCGSLGEQDQIERVVGPVREARLRLESSQLC